MILRRVRDDIKKMYHRFAKNTSRFSIFSDFFVRQNSVAANVRNVPDSFLYASPERPRRIMKEIVGD